MNYYYLEKQGQFFLLFIRKAEEIFLGQTLLTQMFLTETSLPQKKSSQNLFSFKDIWLKKVWAKNIFSVFLIKLESNGKKFVWSKFHLVVKFCWNLFGWNASVPIQKFLSQMSWYQKYWGQKVFVQNENSHYQRLGAF